MIQRKKRQVKIVLMIIAILAALAFAIIGVITVINGKGTNTEIQEGTQGDLSQYELKSIIVETTLAEEELKKQYKVSSIETLMGGEEDETKLYLLQYNTEEETKKAYEDLKRDSKMQSVDLNKKVTIEEETKKIFEWTVTSGETITSWGGIAMGLDKTLEKINNKTTDKPEIIVAVIDSGLDTEHDAFGDAELKARVLTGFDATGKGDITDNDGHGTNVAGIILESTPDNVKVLPIKALEKGEDGKTVGSMAQILSAINYAVTNGADIINMSLGSDGSNIAQQNAINKAYEKGITCIAASGNGDEKTGEALDLDVKGNDCYPAECNNVIAVGAVKTNLITLGTLDEGMSQFLVESYQNYIKTTTDDLSIASFSNYGSKLDFVAPGVTILGLTANSGLGIYDGTSQAAPHISAVAATIKSYNKDYTSDQIEEIMQYYSVDLGAEGRDNLYGNGFVSFKEMQECPCDSEKCDEIYCFGCEDTDCIYHLGKTNKLSSIEITEEPTKTTYYKGEEFDPTGMVVTAEYSDSTKKAVEGYTHSSIVGMWTSLDEENPITGYTVDITYTEDKVTKHTTQYITMRNDEPMLAPELVSIEITTPPTKIEYLEGETFDKAGMVVTATYNDGSKQIVTDYTCSPDGELTVNTSEIVITYKEGEITKETKQSISVAAKENEKVLSEIKITTPPIKTTYEAGEEFDRAGMVVTAIYSDNTEETITDYTILPARALQASDKKVTIQYTKNGVTKQVEQAITMNGQEGNLPVTKTLSEISVSNRPNKTSYIAGESFDPSGMKIIAKYSDGSTETVEDYTYSPSGALKVTDTKVVITYKDKTTNVSITVQATTTNPGNDYPGLNSNMFNVEVKNPNSTQVNVGDSTISGGQLAYTGLEETIIPIGICVAIAVIAVSYVSYRKYRDI